MLKLGVSGCQGRMGQSIIRLALEDKESFDLTTILEHKNHPEANGSINGIAISTDTSALENSDVLIDFTLPEGSIENLRACVKYGKGIVIGTTGFTLEQTEEIQKAGETIPVVFSSNMSIGVNILFQLVKLAAEKTGQAYTATMEEAHHIHKKDAPSGTAKTMAELAEEASGKKVENIESIREGEIIGDHSITFESNEDVLTISHHAKTRDMFAKGALVAAKFLEDKKSGLFNMQDVLGLN